MLFPLRGRSADQTAAVEHLADGPGHGRETVGFGQEPAGALRQQVVNLGFGDEPAGEQDLRLRVERTDPEEGLVAALLGHDHIEQHQIDLRGVRLIDFNGVEPVFGEQHRVAEFQEGFDQEVLDGFVVVDDQDRFGPGRQLVLFFIHNKNFLSPVPLISGRRSLKCLPVAGKFHIFSSCRWRRGVVLYILYPTSVSGQSKCTGYGHLKMHHL